jgi:hypothetical protein
MDVAVLATLGPTLTRDSKENPEGAMVFMLMALCIMHERHAAAEIEAAYYKKALELLIDGKQGETNARNL